jgi:hypothetical protein
MSTAVRELRKDLYDSNHHLLTGRPSVLGHSLFLFSCALFYNISWSSRWVTLYCAALLSIPTLIELFHTCFNMTLSFFAQILLACASLSWAEPRGRRHEHSVVSFGSANGHSISDSLVHARDTLNFQDVEDQVDDDRRRRRTWWKPTDAPFQIILSKVVLPSNDTEEDIEPSFASIFEVDLFDTPTSTFRALKRSGKKVICYFSAGTSEDWRPDYKEFTTADKGDCDEGWAGKNS